ncbi:ABC transporter substrate-binding protein [Pandoraea soli]|uniref:Nitrate ABC transporter substrate-binding protein n=1 Tax=Pandoraea soli TaxID=2508293 RepID=A0ABY6VT50_9BURK|nr:ABC transporter substrate-binding protein [Pandoraea soli]VVD85632.1 nitrate ABC transporter substrate-binding protein [Pandoraea soli]
MKLKVKLAVRDWDYLTPLALGDVKSSKLDIDVHRVQAVQDWTQENDYDAGEVSFSKYVQGMATGGDYPLWCLPHFLMRGFRQRCILTSTGSDITRVEDLAGKRIGVTGWSDSGNTWTRTLLRRAGIGIEDVRWYAGRLTESDPIIDRLGRFARPGRIDATPNEKPLVDMVKGGELDALFSPFLPPAFFSDHSGLRFLLSDFRAEEVRYFREVGYVPGIHILGVKPDLCKQYPWLAGEIGGIIDESSRVWSEKRAKYQDTTPWLLDDIARATRDLPATWNSNGFASNEKMIDDFAVELYEQRIIETRLDAKTLFRI